MLEMEYAPTFEDDLIVTDAQIVAEHIRNAILRGGINLFACCILGLPLCTSGLLQPVSLPCCGVVVSHCGAQRLLQSGHCQLCKRPLTSEMQVIEASKIVIRAIDAERKGAGARFLDMTQVETPGDRRLGSGGEGVVYDGMFEGQAVAVKKMELHSMDWRKMNSIRHVLCVSHFAANFSRNICRMKGYCASVDELWCVSQDTDQNMCWPEYEYLLR